MTQYLQTVRPPTGRGVHLWKQSSYHILMILSMDGTYNKPLYGLFLCETQKHRETWRFVEHYLENVPEIPQSGMPSAHDEVHHYLGTNDDREGPQVVDTQSIGLADDRGVPRVMDTQSIGSAYDRYLQSLVITKADNAPTFFHGPKLDRAGGSGSIPTLGVRDPLSSARGPELARAGGGGSIPALGVRDPLSLACGPELARADGGGSILALGAHDPLPSARGLELAPDRRRRPRETLTLPPGASNTLYIEGLPSDSTRREVARYKEVRLVKRDSKYPAEDPLILGFVDFVNPECAATALRALQGYKMDEDGIHSTYLRLQFSKFPGRRFGGRGKR
ncbi:hypothetical protein R3W88_012406 [Solanum pinnatisectum]|uniref:RRM domain-containing protein n=1 Tax=Solanum pinnatisectum TaxID=50273 RepID=A0AAV9LA96_9SOLN|nr:hypothetical protein R3W88_012406 [Solanum pinnatisectum]